MYASVPEVEEIGRDDSFSLLHGCTAAESARQRGKPFLLCEYVHAMGNGAGAIDQYEEVFDRHPRLHGGFVWEWRDHGIRTTTDDGVEFFAYGGDFGEDVHDGNFVTDGLVLSDGSPTPSLFELAQVISPVRLRLRGGTVEVRNLRHSHDTSDLAVRWRVEREGRPVAAGELECEPVDPGKSVVRDLAVPEVGEDAESWLTVEVVQRRDTPWAAAGHRIVHAQRRLRPARPVVVRATRTDDDRLPSRLGPAEFDGRGLVALAGAPIHGPRLELWRAPIDNDRGSEWGAYDHGDPYRDDGRGTPAPSNEELWTAHGLHRLRTRVLAVRGGPDAARLVRRWAPANSPHAMMTDERWTRVGDGVHCRIDITPTKGWDFVLPRIGVRWDLPDDVDGAEWFGTGPHDSYPDSRRAARVGRFEAGIDDLTVQYARPQESGHRSDLRTLTLRRGGADWLGMDAIADVQGRLPGFTLSRYSAQQLAAARHPHELRPSGSHFLYLDAAQHGLGSRACGPDVWPTAALYAEARTLQFFFRAL